VSDKFRVPARDRDVVEKNIGFRVTTRHGAVLVKEKTSSHVRATANNEKSGPGWQGRNNLLLLQGHSTL
jgi:epoxyqueuosine reductase QueG